MPACKKAQEQNLQRKSKYKSEGGPGPDFAVAGIYVQTSWVENYSRDVRLAPGHESPSHADQSVDEEVPVRTNGGNIVEIVIIIGEQVLVRSIFNVCHIVPVSLLLIFLGHAD